MTQEEFDKAFVTSTELCERVGIHRSSVLYSVKRGKLPEPIIIRRKDGGTHIALWNREEIEPLIETWHEAREQLRENGN